MTDHLCPQCGTDMRTINSVSISTDGGPWSPFRCVGCTPVSGDALTRFRFAFNGPDSTINVGEFKHD